MNPPGSLDSGSASEFRLKEWLVQPNLNRLSHGEQTVQLEPKLMDVLVYLASRSGEVVSKQDITDAVWSEVFITESVITRAIAGLRRAFADDVRNPRFIETISKRGYRLLVAPERLVADRGPAVAPAAPIGRTTVPYVVGQWVRGDAFYGRRQLLEEVLGGQRNWLWLMGTRRIGKTSVLKQLEYLADARPELGFLPLFWDMQGAENPRELGLDFGDALLDAEDRFERHGLDVEELRSDDLTTSIGRVRRAARSNGLTLLLLCDEVEELIQLHRQDPGLLRKLRRAMQSSEGMRSVLAASPRLWCLAEPGAETSPFLDGFTPPIYVGALDGPDAQDLIRQSQLPAEVRPGLAEEDVSEVARQCGNHPYLMQMLCKRTLRTNDLAEAVAELHQDRSASFFFEVDMALLSREEQDLLRGLADQPPRESATAAAGSLQHLQGLGMVQLDDEGGARPASVFLQSWLRGSS